MGDLGQPEAGGLTPGAVESAGLLSNDRRLTLSAMSRQVATVIYVLAMIAVIVGLDVAFFRHRIWDRLLANIGLVMVFAAFYLRFFRLS